jgi:hypothetical protein
VADALHHAFRPAERRFVIFPIISLSLVVRFAAVVFVTLAVDRSRARSDVETTVR